MRKIIFAILGAILGVPISFYFQPEMVQIKVGGGVGGYIEHFDDIIKDSNLLGTVILCMVILAIVGALIGYLIDDNEAKKSKQN